jgi:hypothetical protein
MWRTVTYCKHRFLRTVGPLQRKLGLVFGLATILYKEIAQAGWCRPQRDLIASDCEEIKNYIRRAENEYANEFL